MYRVGDWYSKLKFALHEAGLTGGFESDADAVGFVWNDTGCTGLIRSSRPRAVLLLLINMVI